MTTHDINVLISDIKLVRRCYKYGVAGRIIWCWLDEPAELTPILTEDAEPVVVMCFYGLRAADVYHARVRGTWPAGAQPVNQPHLHRIDYEMQNKLLVHNEIAAPELETAA